MQHEKPFRKGHFYFFSSSDSAESKIFFYCSYWLIFSFGSRSVDPYIFADPKDLNFFIGNYLNKSDIIISLNFQKIPPMEFSAYPFFYNLH